MATKKTPAKAAPKTKAPELNLENGQIIIFRNPTQDEGKNRPDLYGFYKDSKGQDMSISLWKTVSKKGEHYLSGKTKPKDAMENTHNIALFVNSEKTAENAQPEFKGVISQGDTRQMEVVLWRGHSKADGKFYMNGYVKDLVHAQAFDFADATPALEDNDDQEMPF